MLRTDRLRIQAWWFMAALFLIARPCAAQNKGIGFASYNQAGIIVGESRTDWAFQSVNGIQANRWFAGLGAGVDYYYYRTLPVFIDGKFFPEKDKKLFIYGDIGCNFPLDDHVDKNMVYYDDISFRTGIYTDAGMGFKIPLAKKTALLFSIGHSYKRSGAQIGTRICGIAGPCTVDYSKLSLDFHRIIFKMGILF